MVIDPTETYLSTTPDGDLRTHTGGPQFWAQPEAALTALGRDWLVSEFTFDANWSVWEMHPEGDELVYVLAGHVTLVLELAEGTREVEVRGRGAVVVPRGVWHTAKVHAPSRSLHLTRGAGTQHRVIAAPAV